MRRIVHAAPVGLLRAGSLLATLALAAALFAAPASAEGQGQFVLRCVYSHTLMDDPIVFPGQAGVAHSHDFFGNRTANAGSTLESMLAGDTTCRVPSDTAGYWAPTAYLNGVPIQPTVMRIYYLGSPDVETFPPGLQLVGGNKDATSGAENPHVRWSCGETKEVKTPRATVPYDCTFWANQHRFVDGVIAIVEMPNCWDGVGLTPASVTYPVGGSCPTGFPRVLPRLSERVHYGILDPVNRDGSMALTLSSGEYFTYHADFWNTWQQPRLDQLVSECLVAHVHCGSVDASREVDWVSEFGTPRTDVAYATATDGSAVYVAGIDNQTLPGQRSGRDADAYVRKYGSNGNLLWTRQFGSSGADRILSIAADDDGVAVAGSTSGRLPGQEESGGVDAFVARFGSTGRPLWVRQFGTQAIDQATAVAIVSGRVFVAGTTGGPLGVRHGGSSDAFVAQLDASGALTWVRQFGGEGADEASGLAVRAGRVVVVGSTTGQIQGTYAGGASDGLVVIFRATGTLLFRQAIGTEGADRIRAVVARAGGLFVAGSTDGTLTDQTSAGGRDAFIGKLASSGLGLWFRQFGSPADDEAVAIGALAKGIYVAGSTAGELPDGSAVGGWDAFIRKYLPNGTEIWTQQLGTIDLDSAYGVAVERTGLTLSGTTHGAFEGQSNGGDADSFLVRVAFS
jgi:hypothetical protein